MPNPLVAFPESRPAGQLLVNYRSAGIRKRAAEIGGMRERVDSQRRQILSDLGIQRIRLMVEKRAGPRRSGSPMDVPLQGPFGSTAFVKSRIGNANTCRKGSAM
jgi:hypothetical protein